MMVQVAFAAGSDRTNGTVPVNFDLIYQRSVESSRLAETRSPGKTKGGSLLEGLEGYREVSAEGEGDRRAELRRRVLSTPPERLRELKRRVVEHRRAFEEPLVNRPGEERTVIVARRFRSCADWRTPFTVNVAVGRLTVLEFGWPLRAGKNKQTYALSDAEAFQVVALDERHLAVLPRLPFRVADMVVFVKRKGPGGETECPLLLFLRETTGAQDRFDGLVRFELPTLDEKKRLADEDLLRLWETYESKHGISATDLLGPSWSCKVKSDVSGDAFECRFTTDQTAYLFLRGRWDCPEGCPRQVWFPTEGFTVVRKGADEEPLVCEHRESRWAPRKCFRWR
ncbi:hypothetical protein [Thermosulfurimonas sp. F29]|uniref:hypothetical protein n=1 Tax=Thermosulfurimonas sp. F29 TaxID=2867247 RepID=UPI001C83E5F3|nr:hypothetical protein [Thermosulfurimonas sp. F29]MBX6423383.1 hypothetical protein [Thermosulfurimonas sp. F29]